MNDRKSENIFSIILTNWVHIIGFYISIYLNLILITLIKGTNSSLFEILTEYIPYPAFVVILYYYPHLFLFFALVAGLDFVGFNLKSTDPQLILVIEWIIVIIVFSFTNIEFRTLMILAAFLFLTQLYRKSLIVSICKKQRGQAVELRNF